MDEKQSEKKEKIKQPPNSIAVKIGDNEYTIKLPNNGQLIDIEVRKINITQGTHKDLVYGGIQARDAYLLAESISTFEVLIPDLKKDMTVSMYELNLLQSKSLFKAYEQYYTWMDNWRQFVNQE